MQRSISQLSATALASWLGLALAAFGACLLPGAAQAAMQADSSALVECLLPGQIRMIAGHASMGPRHPIQATAASCRERGGEYTVAEQTTPMPAPSPAARSTGSRMVNCLLPRQLRQLGSKARYRTARRVVRTTRMNCESRGGASIGAAQARALGHGHRKSGVKRAAPRKQP